MRVLIAVIGVAFALRFSTARSHHRAHPLDRSESPFLPVTKLVTMGW